MQRSRAAHVEHEPSVWTLRFSSGEKCRLTASRPSRWQRSIWEFEATQRLKLERTDRGPMMGSS